MANHRSYLINEQIFHVSATGRDRYSKFHVINSMIFKHNLDINNNTKIYLKYL